MKAMSSLLFILSLAPVAIAQESSGAVNARTVATRDGAEEKLIQLEKEWAAAGPRGDVGFFERIAAEDYVIVDVDCSIRNKKEEIANFRQETQTAQTVDDIKVRILDKSAAVVVGRFTIAGTLAGQPNNFAGRFTDVWLKRNGRWQIVSTQNTRLPEADTAKVPPDSFFIAIEKEDWEALKNKDKAAATRLLADDFVGMYDSGFSTKAEWIKQIDGQYTIDAYTIEDPKVLRPSPTTALLLYKSTCKGTGEWADYCSHTQYISDLMVQRNGKWDDLFSQDTIAVPATSVSVSGSAKSEKVIKNEIEDLERLAWEAIKTKDKAALAGFSADDYFDFGSDGRVDKAKGLSEGWMGSDSTLSDFTFDDLQVKLFSDDIALITYRGTYRGTTRGKPDSGAGFYSDLYMKRNGKWLSVFTQDSNLRCAGL